MSMPVELEWYEAEQAIFVGAQREAEARMKGLKHRPKTGSDPLENHIESAGAEKAVGKLLNLDWHASVNTFGEGCADVGESIEVRYRRNLYDLIVRDHDPEDRIYVLVWGEMPKYVVMGWMWGSDAKKPEFRANHGDHGPAFFVPAKHLHPVEELTYRSLNL